MSKLTGEELAKELERFVNGGSEKETEAFVNGFMSMHNTLEQKAFGVLLKVVDAMANKKYVDGRNEASHIRAKHMVEGIKAGTVKDLQSEDSYYWRDDKAKDWVYGEHFDITHLPLV